MTWGHFFADLWLLLGLRWQIAWNQFRSRKPVSQIVYAVGGLWLAIVAGGVSATIGFGAGAALRYFPRLGLEPLLPGLILTVVALLVLFSSFGVALGSLFLSSDLDLLMSAPVDGRAVFASKILDGLVAYYALTIVTAVPALVTYGLGLRYGPLYYGLAIVAVLSTPLLPAGIGALLVLLVARFAPARRVREVLGLVAALAGISCSLVSQTSRVWTQSLVAADGAIDPGTVLAQLQRLQRAPIPSLVAGRGLAAAGAGDWSLALGDIAGGLLLTIGPFVGCVLLAERLYATGWVRMQSSGVARRSKERVARDAARSGWLGRAPAWAAIALKDWRIIPRDLRNFAQLLSPLLLLPVLYLNLLGGGGRRRGGPVDALGRLRGEGLDPAGVAIAVGVLTATVLIFSRVAATGISMEGRSWWLLKAAPISGFELLRGKLMAAVIPFAILSTVLMSGAALWRGFSPVGFLYGWFGVELLGTGMLAVSVGASVPWARLDWDDPRRMGSGLGSLISTLVGGALALVAGGLLCLPLFAQLFRPALLTPAWIAGPAGALAVTAGVSWAALQLGLRFLSRVGEA